jgi:TolA-binding protein
MMERSDYLLDIDALARRIRPRDLRPERSAAMRRAVLEAAYRRQRAPARPLRSWGIGLALAGAAAASLIALRASDRASDRAREAPRAPISTTRDAAVVERLPDGVRSVHASQPVHLTQGDTTLTAPPGAQFEVDVRGDQLKYVTVRTGWVVIASARTPATIVAEQQHWSVDLPPPAIPSSEPPPSAPPPSAPPPSAPPPSAPPPRAPRSPAIASAAREAVPAAPRAQQPKSPPAEPERSASSPVPELAAADRVAAIARLEQEFRDGLRTLFVGDARGALGLLAHACGEPSTSQDDVCYWAAVARLRSGDRGGARQALLDVLARWPGSTHAGEASVALGWLLLEAGDRAGARARFATGASDRLPAVRADAARGLLAAQ